MRLALDTNAYSAAARGQSKAVALVRAADHLTMPFVVLAELRAGFAIGGAGRRNEAALTRFLASRRVAVQYPDEQATHHYASVFAQLRRQGTPIPTNDIWIGALVLQRDLCSSPTTRISRAFHRWPGREAANWSTNRRRRSIASRR